MRATKTTVGVKKACLLISLLILGGTAVFVLKVCFQKNTDSQQAYSWRVYRNSELGHEIQYPSSWYFEKRESIDRYDPKQINQDSLCLEGLEFFSKKGEKRYTRVGKCVGCLAQDSSSFSFTVSDLIPKIESIKEWIGYQNSRRNAPIDVSFSLMNIDGFEKVVSNRLTESRGIVRRISFVHKNRLYRITYTSGSKEQYEKDLDIFENMFNSFKILPNIGFGIYLKSGHLVIAGDDVESYDRETHGIKLTEEAARRWYYSYALYQESGNEMKKPNLYGGLYQKEFVVKLSGKELYSGVFWSKDSPIVYQGISIIDTKGAGSDRKIWIETDYSDLNTNKEDLRDNPDLMNYFRGRGRLIE